MYNLNLLTLYYFKEFLSRCALVGGFDYDRHEHKVRTGEAIHSELVKPVLNRKNV